MTKGWAPWNPPPTLLEAARRFFREGSRPGTDRHRSEGSAGARNCRRPADCEIFCAPLALSGCCNSDFVHSHGHDVHSPADACHGLCPAPGIREDLELAEPNALESLCTDFNRALDDLHAAGFDLSSFRLDSEAEVGDRAGWPRAGLDGMLDYMDLFAGLP